MSDRDGRYIPNLQQADFEIFHDGKEQQIEFFAANEESITVALLIDTSNSTRDVLGDIKDSAKSFIKLLSPRDRATIVSFDYNTHILSPLTSDQEQLRNAIKHAEDPSRIRHDTSRRGVSDDQRSFKGINGRKAIIVLTDGKDAGSFVRMPELLYRLEESDTMVYTVMFKTGERGPRPRFDRGVFGGGFPGRNGRFPGGRFRRAAASASNAARNVKRNRTPTPRVLRRNDAGRFFSSKNGKLKKTFAEILEELRFQYRLGFYPPDDKGAAVHQIRVRVERPNVVVRSRSGYRTPAPLKICISGRFRSEFAKHLANRSQSLNGPGSGRCRRQNRRPTIN